MGINLAHNIYILKKCSCNKCYISDSLAEKNQYINSPQNHNILFMNNKNTIEIDKKNSLFKKQIEDNSNKNKLKQIFIEKRLTSLTNSSKGELVEIFS